MIEHSCLIFGSNAAAWRQANAPGARAGVAAFNLFHFAHRAHCLVSLAFGYAAGPLQQPVVQLSLCRLEVAVRELHRSGGNLRFCNLTPSAPKEKTFFIWYIYIL